MPNGFNGTSNEAGGNVFLSAPLLCGAGCGNPVKEGAKYCSPRCRTRAWELAHPRLDLSGISVEQLQRAERMIQEAIRAAKEGLVRAIVDARHPVKREKDERPSCRVRLSSVTWSMLGEMVDDGWFLEQHPELVPESKSSLVETLVIVAYERWKGVAP